MKRFGTAVLASVCATGAFADPVALTSGDQLSQDLTLYLFLPTNTSGTSGLAGVETDLDLSLSDVLDVLDFGSSLRYEAWRNDFGFLVDGNYYGISQDFSASSGIARLDVDVEQWWLSFQGAYRVGKGTLGNGGRYSFDLQGGLRYTSLKQEIDIDGPGPGLALGGTETWWEPVVGARYLWEITDRWTGGVLVDAGGFGVGDNDLAWSATAGADYEFENGGSIKFGLRYYSIDFETERSDGTFTYDVTQVGPFVGYTFRF
ncbi:MAG: hypothetical protein AAGF50_07650 [Pseudomonadota bacterium]